MLYIELENADCKITIDGPLKSNINWNHSDKTGLLNEIELLDSQNYSTYNKRAEIVANSSRAKQLEMNYESFIHCGDLLSARDSARDLFSLEQSKANLHRVTHISSLIKSLDTEWLPEINSSNNLDKEPQSGKILHLFKVSYPFESTGGSIRNLNIVSSQKKAGIEPFVVTPLNYPRIFKINEFPIEEKIENVRHIRLDLGSQNSSQLTYITKICNSTHYSWLELFEKKPRVLFTLLLDTRVMSWQRWLIPYRGIFQYLGYTKSGLSMSTLGQTITSKLRPRFTLNSGWIRKIH